MLANFAAGVNGKSGSWTGIVLPHLTIETFLKSQISFSLFHDKGKVHRRVLALCLGRNGNAMFCRAQLFHRRPRAVRFANLAIGAPQNKNGLVKALYKF